MITIIMVGLILPSTEALTATTIVIIIVILIVVLVMVVVVIIVVVLIIIIITCGCGVLLVETKCSIDVVVQHWVNVLQHMVGGQCVVEGVIQWGVHPPGDELLVVFVEDFDLCLAIQLFG